MGMYKDLDLTIPTKKTEVMAFAGTNETFQILKLRYNIRVQP